MTFTPMIASPIVPVEAKIVGIPRHFRPAGTEASRTDTPVHPNTLLEDAVSLPDMIAIFLGVLELVKLRRLLLGAARRAGDRVWCRRRLFGRRRARKKTCRCPSTTRQKVKEDGT